MLTDPLLCDNLLRSLLVLELRLRHAGVDDLRLPLDCRLLGIEPLHPGAVKMDCAVA